MPPKKKSSKFKKQPIPEDFELSDDEPAMIQLNEEQKLTSKNIIFECPNWFTKLQLQNEIEINPKGITCRCSPCSFKITKNDKTMSVSKNDEGDITLESEDHSIQFSFNKQITPESEEDKTKNQMITDVMNTRSSKKQMRINDMD